MSDVAYTGSNLGPLQPKGGDGWDAFPTATKADTWDAFPEAKPSKGAKETAIDVAKSAGIGVARGAIGVAGLIGDMTDLGAKGIEAASNLVSDATGTERYKRPEGGSALDKIPTTQSITKAVEGATGDFYKPETTAGEYARTVGEFLPAALAGPGGMARKVVMQAAVPGVASEAAGQATEGTAVEPYARAGAGLVAGFGGAVLSRPGSTASAIRSQLPEGVTQATVDDARQLMQAAADRGIRLTWPEALSQSAGRPVLSDTQRILESAPGSRTRMQDFYAERPQQIDQAALNEFGRIAPGTPNPSQIGPQASVAANETLGDVRQTINNAAQPFYHRAEGVLLTPAEMQQVQRIPGYEQARDAVRNSPQLNSYVAHLPDNSVGFLNEVKKYFDQANQNAGSRFNQGRNQQVAAVHGRAAEAVRQIGEALSPDYAAALAIQRQARTQYLEPLLQGPLGRMAKRDATTRSAIEALFPSSPLPNSHNEIATAVGALAHRNPGAATQLVRAHVESVFNEASKNLQGGPNQFGGAKFANRLVGNIQQRANLQAAIESLPNGNVLWNGFDNFLEAVEATGTRQAKGSLTAFNSSELKAMSGSGVIGEAAKTAASPGKWLSIVNDKWGQWQLGNNLDELARIFTDPNSAQALRRIVNMPRGSREAGYIASRLILQAENAAVQPREPRRQ